MYFPLHKELPLVSANTKKKKFATPSANIFTVKQQKYKFLNW